MSLTRIMQDAKRWEKERDKALSRQDASGYAEAIDHLGQEPNDQLLYENGLVELEERRKKRLERVSRRRETKINYDIFKQELGGNDYINPARIFDNTNEKLEILREAGYTHVYGRGGVRIKIENAGPAQVGKVFQNVYNQAFGRE